MQGGGVLSFVAQLDLDTTLLDVFDPLGVWPYSKTSLDEMKMTPM